jgi:hypothetical protein
MTDTLMALLSAVSNYHYYYYYIILFASYYRTGTRTHHLKKAKGWLTATE